LKSKVTIRSMDNPDTAANRVAANTNSKMILEVVGSRVVVWRNRTRKIRANIQVTIKGRARFHLRKKLEETYS
jgi:RNA-binding protein YhbY